MTYFTDSFCHFEAAIKSIEFLKFDYNFQF